MAYEKIIQGSNADEVFEQINEDFEATFDMLEYNITIDQAGQKIFFAIEIDPGGGFEGGFETTTLSAPLHTTPGFNFAIHHEGFLDEIGKFFGMNDVVTGYTEFDKKVIVKTDNEEKVIALFADDDTRSIFAALNAFTLEIITHNTSEDKHAPFLEFNIERALFDKTELKEIYTAFFKILQTLNTL